MVVFDVVIVGAGLSGISAAYRLKTEHPNLKFALLEARASVGGTWDLFRYPGVRSDSDMFSFGFPFEPWKGEESVADGDTIRRYIQDTVEKHHIDEHILFQHRLKKAEWTTQERAWSLNIHTGEDESLRWSSRYLWLCTGYYKYEHGYQPEIPGLKNYRGEIVHPQQWPDNFDFEREIVVLGSGATTVTLVPELTKLGARVTQLQRSPGFVSEVPRIDPWVHWLKTLVPERWATFLLRWKGILYQSFVFRLARKFPAFTRDLLLKPLTKMFGEEFVSAHFSPRYNPWEQRLCVDADGEYLRALQQGLFQILTDEIVDCDAEGFLLKSGERISADVLVTATGLVLELFGATELVVDGKPVESSEHLVYKGCMLNDLPNLFLSLGYTNMSWTLKCDLIARYVCRLLHFTKERGFQTCTPRRTQAEECELIDFSSGYFQRASHILPKQGVKSPWKLHQSYILDLFQTSYAPLDDSTMEFG